jgi:hypothetical protein
LALNSPHPTAYPAINLILQRLLSEGQIVLGDTFSGMYLYGSLHSIVLVSIAGESAGRKIPAVGWDLQILVTILHGAILIEWVLAD